MRALMEAGAEFGITPYGTEALNVLRIEKGHAGRPGVQRPDDGARSWPRQHDVARQGLYRPGPGGASRSDRRRSPDPGGREAGRPIPLALGGRAFLPLGAGDVAANDEGHLTSVAWSPELGHDIGLGFLAAGRERIGERIRAVDLLRGNDVECVVCSPVFVDPEGERNRG